MTFGPCHAQYETARLAELVVKHNTQSGRKPFSIEDYYKSQVEPSDWRLCLHKGIVNKQFHLLIMSLGLESLRLLSLFPLLITHTPETHLVVVHLCLSLLHHTRKLPIDRISPDGQQR